MRNAIGRPTVYTEELASEILELIASGRSLREICKQENIPSRKTIHEWIQQDRESFRDRYALAKEQGCDEIADEVFDISDNASNDWMESNDPENPGYRFNVEHVQRSRLRVDARKWYLSKIAPKKYGEASTTKITGDAENPLVTKNVTSIDFTGLTTEQLRVLSSIKIGDSNAE